MATIILRIAKGSPLTNQEADNNINNLNNELITKLPSASYTANDVLAKLLTVDGAGSGLDADLLDGLSSSSTLPLDVNKSSVVTRDSSGNFTANNITATVSNANALNGVNSNGFISRISVGNHIARGITGSGSDIIVNNGDGISGNPVISAGTNLARLDSTNSYALPQSFGVITANALSNDGNNNLFTGDNNLSNTSTNGFVYIPNITGTPTGVPTLNIGRTPLVWDATNNKLWIYSAGTWNSVANDIPNTSITPVKLSTGAPSWDINGNTQIFGNTNLGNANTDVTTISGPISVNSSVGNSGDVLISRGNNATPIWGGNSPSGTIITFAGNVSPLGYLECNGAAISRTTNAGLFSVIGTIYGAGNGTTTFNLPDLRGQFIRGWSNGSAIDNGRVFGTRQEATGIDDQVLQTVHLFYDNPDGALYAPRLLNSAPGQAGVNRTFQRFKVSPTNVALLFCIKT